MIWTMEKTAGQIANIKLNCREMSERRSELSSLPSHVFVELTRRCNLRCFMCARTAAGMTGAGPDMPWDLYLSLAGQLFPAAVLVELNGIGESALMPRWHDALAVAGGYSFHPLVVTNGQALDDESIDFFVRRDGVLRVSVDAVTQELYSRLRPGARIDRLLGTLARIRRAARLRGNGGFALDFVTVLSRENLRELEDLVRLAARFGAETHYLQHLVALTPEAAPLSLLHSPREADDALWRVRTLARQLGVNLVAPPFLEEGEQASLSSCFGGDPRRLTRTDRIIMEHRDFAPAHCIEPWNNTVVEHDGAVKPCCVSETVLGNLSEKPFRELWNGPGYVSLRRQMLGDEPVTDSSCLKCYAVQPARAKALLRHEGT